jgi:hypothetical protein
MTLAPADAVTSKIGVPHYNPTRAGFPSAFVLTASIGSLRPPSDRETYSVTTEWAFAGYNVLWSYAKGYLINRPRFLL